MFFERNDRCFRAPDDDLTAMDILQDDGQWEPYLGDIAAVLAFGTVVDSCETNLAGNTAAAKKAWDARGRRAARPSSGPVDTEARAANALRTHKPSTRKKQQWAKANETVVAKMISGTHTDDNAPTDVNVVLPRVQHGVEVKTLLDNSNSKVTMHPASLRRKLEWAHTTGATLHTVIVDDRDKFSAAGKKYWSGHRVYYARGVGSFNVPGNLTPVKDAAHLRQLMGLDS